MKGQFKQKANLSKNVCILDNDFQERYEVLFSEFLVKVVGKVYIYTMDLEKGPYESAQEVLQSKKIASQWHQAEELYDVYTCTCS